MRPDPDPDPYPDEPVTRPIDFDAYRREAERLRRLAIGQALDRLLSRLRDGWRRIR